MKFLKCIVLAFAFLLTILLIVTALLPEDANIERTIMINTSSDISFDVVNTTKYREIWSPWSGMDRNIIYEYSGPKNGVGSIQSWNSKGNKLGKGEFEIIFSELYDCIRTNLKLNGEDFSQSTWIFTNKNGKTQLRWNMNIPLSFFNRWFGLAFDALMGPQMEIGLKNIKNISESIDRNKDINGGSQ